MAPMSIDNRYTFLLNHTLSFLLSSIQVSYESRQNTNFSPRRHRMDVNLPYIINHVFCPLKLPQKDDLDIIMEQALCETVHQCAEEYQTFLPVNQKWRWERIKRMLVNLCDTQESYELSKEQIKRSMAAMHPGGRICPSHFPPSSSLLFKWQTY